MESSLRWPSMFRMNPSHFVNPQYKDHIKNMWERGHMRGEERGWSPFGTLNRCITKTGQIDRSWGSHWQRRVIFTWRFYKKDWAELKRLWKFYHITMLVRWMFWWSGRISWNIQLIKHSEWIDFIIHARWAKEGDRSTPLFYKNFKELSTDKGIPELFNPGGVLTLSWKGISISFFAR